MCVCVLSYFSPSNIRDTFALDGKRANKLMWRAKVASNVAIHIPSESTSSFTSIAFDGSHTDVLRNAL